jgi:hypothetical protein
MPTNRGRTGLARQIDRIEVGHNASQGEVGILMTAAGVEYIQFFSPQGAEAGPDHRPPAQTAQTISRG